MGPKAYEQAVGFLRIINGKEPLDATGIHPEMYDKTYAFIEKELHIPAKKLTLPLKDITTNTKQLRERAEKYGIGYDTSIDIIKELQRPGQDPRDTIAAPTFAAEIKEITDLKVGMKLQGIVRNITDFGAFVDIGLHNDGLVHRSQLADTFVAHPSNVVSLGQQVTVKVLDIDMEREKVGLTMKTGDSSTAQQRKNPVSTIPLRPKNG